jgi:hypothetical protein
MTFSLKTTVTSSLAATAPEGAAAGGARRKRIRAADIKTGRVGFSRIRDPSYQDTENGGA